MQKQIRVGIVGAGMMGKTHTEALRRIPGVEVAALADTDRSLAQKTCEELFIPSVYTDAREMIQKEQLDSVHVCTPNFAHYDVCRLAIGMGCHVYCEKPLANTYEEAKSLCRLAEEHQVTAAVNFNYRHNAIVQEMHERVCSQDWGRTFLVHGHYIQDWMMYEDDYNWRCDPKLGGKSRTIADIGSHWFDTVQFILSKKIVRVYANLITVLPQRKKYAHQAQTFARQSGEDYQLTSIDSEDAAFIMVQFEDGTMGNLVVSQVSGGRKNDFQIHVDGSRYGMSWRQEYPDQLLVGERDTGTTLIHSAPDTLHGRAKRYASLPGGHVVAWNDALKNAIAQFYDYLRYGGEKHFADFTSGAAIVKLVETCLKSNEDECWVDV